jgi:hypothetical protein
MTKNNPKNNRINPEIPRVARDDEPFCHPEERFQATRDLPLIPGCLKGEIPHIRSG